MEEEEEYKLDEKGFIFMSADKKPYLCKLHYGQPWVFSWQGFWKALRKSNEEELLMSRSRAVTQDIWDYYNKKHGEHMSQIRELVKQGKEVDKELEEHIEFEEMYFHTLGLCGCGNQIEVQKMLLKLLELQDYDKNSKFTVTGKEETLKAFKEVLSDTDTVKDFIFHILAGAGFLEHEGSIGAAKVNSDGKRFMKLLRKQVNE